MDSLLLDTILRWAHVLAATIWLGSIYFNLFVLGPAHQGLSPEAKKSLTLSLMPRAVCWVRWSSLVTLLLGLALFVVVYYGQGHMRDPEGALTGRAMLVMGGMTLGIVMWLNIWFLVLPAHKRVLRALDGGSEPAARDQTLANRLVRFNVYLSGPLIVFMVGTPHYAALDGPFLAVALAGGLVAMHLLLMLARHRPSAA